MTSSAKKRGVLYMCAHLLHVCTCVRLILYFIIIIERKKERKKHDKNVKKQSDMNDKTKNKTR